jgi:hypothetical protein
MDNPYQSPSSDSMNLPGVDVISRPRWGWRTCEQVYRFGSRLGLDLLQQRILNFYCGHSAGARLLTSTPTTMEFERSGSWLRQLLGGSDKTCDQTIVVTLETGPSGTAVCCCYRLRVVGLALFIPPYELEQEVRELACQCNVQANGGWLPT